MSDHRFVLDELDTLATEAYPGLVVRKDLLRRMRSAFGVPAFVIEFLLGKYCASTDEETIREGLEFVRETLAGKYVKPDEREAVKSAIKQHTSFEIIDKISVRLIETHDKYWARLSNLDLDYINIEESEVRRHDRLLLGGIWAEITLRYDDAYVFRNQNRPFFVERIRPIQLSSRKLDDFVEGRRRFTRDQWLDLLMRSLGYEPQHPYYTRRRKLHYMLRLVPFVEKNFNAVELGPRGTGKSFVYQQLSPYCHLVSGGQTTTAQMFVNLASGQRGLVCLWDVVAFDEAAGVRFTDKSGLNIMKGYMEDGAFSRGRDVINAEGSVVFVGNIDGDIETIVRTSNLFYPLPKEMDTAFYDRIHAYIPGWEFQKTSDAAYTDHFGVVTDYLAEVFRELRKQSYADCAERYFRFGSHLGGRDQKAVRKTVSGLVKLLHPHGEVGREEAEEYPRLRAGDAPARQGAAQEDGRAGVLGHELLLHRPGERPGDLRPRARERHRVVDRRRRAAPRQRLHHRLGHCGQPPGALPPPDADEPRLGPDHPARQPLRQNEGGRQDRRRLPEGERPQPRD